MGIELEAAPHAADDHVREIEGDAPRDATALKNAAPLAAALALAACGGDSGGSSPPPTGEGGGGGGGPPPPTVAKPATDAAAARFLLHAGLSASPGDIEAVKRDGYEPWLDAQMAAPVARSGRSWMTAQGYDRVDANKYQNNSSLADHMAWAQLMMPEDGVRRRIALALSQFFVVSTNGVNFAWRSQAMAKYWDILSARAFGNFRDLLEDITLNPAMGVWLNTRGNRAADSKGREPDENYAREVMQLFTIGLYQLEQDGTPTLGSNGAPIETYTNDDVTGLAKVFTGYDFDYSQNTKIPRPDAPGSTVDSIEYTQLPMTTDPSKWKYTRKSGFHSALEKSFLGTTIPAGTGPEASLKTALDTLFNHPNVGPFFGQQMIQRLVTSNPSPAYVSRVAAAFADNGRGQRGDLRAVFKAILLDQEALSADGLTSWGFGKLREPMLRLAQWARTFGATSSDGRWQVQNLSDADDELAQSPLRSPSVFNFYRPGHIPSNSQAAANDMVAPEFQIVDEISIAGYVNFIEKVIENKHWALKGVSAPYTAELALAHQPDKLVDRLSLLLTADQLTDATKTLIRDALAEKTVTESSSESDKQKRVFLAVLLVMASPEYLVQK